MTCGQIQPVQPGQAEIDQQPHRQHRSQYEAERPPPALPAGGTADAPRPRSACRSERPGDSRLWGLQREDREEPPGAVPQLVQIHNHAPLSRFMLPVIVSESEKPFFSQPGVQPKTVCRGSQCRDFRSRARPETSSRTRSARAAIAWFAQPARSRNKRASGLAGDQPQSHLVGDQDHLGVAGVGSFSQVPHSVITRSSIWSVNS